MISPIRHHGQHDIVKMFLELEDKLDVSNLVSDTKVYGLGGTDKIHRPGWLTRPGTDILYVQAGLFLLEQNPHRYRSLFCCCFRKSKPRLHRTQMDFGLLAVIRE